MPVLVLIGGLLAAGAVVTAMPASAQVCPETIDFIVISGQPNSRPRTEARNSSLIEEEPTANGTQCDYVGDLTFYVISPVPVEIPPFTISGRPWSKLATEL